jgi:hypothetical protein
MESNHQPPGQLVFSALSAFSNAIRTCQRDDAMHLNEPLLSLVLL